MSHRIDREHGALGQGTDSNKQDDHGLLFFYRKVVSKSLLV